MTEAEAKMATSLAPDITAASKPWKKETQIINNSLHTIICMIMTEDF